MIAGPVPKGSVPDALVWDTYDAYHYVRIRPLSGNEDLIIVGGEGSPFRPSIRHGPAAREPRKSGRASAIPVSPLRITAGRARSWSPSISCLFPGGTREAGNIYIHTGDSGHGITNGIAGSLAILPLIIDEDSRYAPVLEPSRKSLTSGPSLGEFVRGQAGVVHSLTDYISPTEVSSVDRIAASDGAIMRQGAIKLACYKADDGTITRRSATCTHMACILHWNTFENAGTAPVWLAVHP